MHRFYLGTKKNAVGHQAFETLDAASLAQVQGGNVPGPPASGPIMKEVHDHQERKRREIRDWGGMVDAIIEDHGRVPR